MPSATADLKSLSDDLLLELIASNREDAFQTLVERHVDRGYAVAYRILQNGSDAEDVVQDAFLQVWTRREMWQSGRAKFSTWLFRVVSNRCIDLLRKPRAETVDELPELEDGNCDQSRDLERREATEMLERAMMKLPDQQRIALVFSYNENMNNSEIAEIMDTTVSAVESLLKRGRQKLRVILKKQSADILNAFTNR
ncbi:sigma-70 family RNA polymerase sigma factor [Roseibium aggregatum]|uniref:RNA polymerase sigma factor n=1 Tax=Roseibium aggregatum TaxID=187304 RepID=A0A939EFI5_9HYPH|nr:sigma-70 family RNA polymerase sigma factor [Roseibium aggregatum]MBN9672048.1 sigma-70 family RNA polymerase sigma factor [Roseibium aggregatum]